MRASKKPARSLKLGKPASFEAFCFFKVLVFISGTSTECPRSCRQELQTSEKQSTASFSSLQTNGELWSVRVGTHYRALGIEIEVGIQWIWIGTHAEYDNIIANLRVIRRVGTQAMPLEMEGQTAMIFRFSF